MRRSDSKKDGSLTVYEVKKEYCNRLMKLVLSEGLIGVRNIRKKGCSWLLFCYSDSDVSFGAVGAVRQFFRMHDNSRSSS